MLCDKRWKGTHYKSHLTLLTCAQVTEALAEDLVTGDLVTIKQGDRVPAGAA